MMRFCSLYGEHVGTMSNPTKLLLSCFELSYVGFWQYCDTQRKNLYLERMQSHLSQFCQIPLSLLTPSKHPLSQSRRQPLPQSLLWKGCYTSKKSCEMNIPSKPKTLSFSHPTLCSISPVTLQPYLHLHIIEASEMLYGVPPWELTEEQTEHLLTENWKIPINCIVKPLA